jgi:general secretion pathway protein G
MHIQKRDQNQSGFTLIELLVVIVVLGILAALAYPAYVSMVRRAQYAEVRQQMGVMSREVQAYLLENGQYPSDTNQGNPPQGVVNWPESPPFDGTYDYDHWGVGGGQCYVQIGFNGDDGQRNYQVHRVNAEPQSFQAFEDDLVLGIDLYDCPIAQGPIRQP